MKSISDRKIAIVACVLAIAALLGPFIVMAVVYRLIDWNGDQEQRIRSIERRLESDDRMRQK